MDPRHCLGRGGRLASVAAVLLGAVAAVVLVTVLEGALLGAVQGRVLRQALREVGARRWTYATMIGPAVAWSLGMVPSTLAALSMVPTLRERRVNRLCWSSTVLLPYWVSSRD
jgi:hypothetical protein